jgi:hypothetical protein
MCEDSRLEANADWNESRPRTVMARRSGSIRVKKLLRENSSMRM